MTSPCNCSSTNETLQTLNCALADASSAASKYFGQPLVIYTFINYVMGYVVMPVLSSFVLPIILAKLLGTPLPAVVLPVTTVVVKSTDPIADPISPGTQNFLVGMKNFLQRYVPTTANSMGPSATDAGSGTTSTGLSEKELIDRAMAIVGIIMTVWNFVQQGLCASGR